MYIFYKLLGMKENLVNAFGAGLVLPLRPT